MSRTLAFSITIALAGCGPDAPALTRGGQPNLLLIVADDLGWGDLGCYGDALAYTPRLDALAAQGVRCTDFYVAAPICSPSRASLLTGRAPERHGLQQVLLEEDEWSDGLDLHQPLLPEYLRDCGYATGLVGKWHLGDDREHRPLRRGFDEFFGMLQASIDYYAHTHHGEHDLWRGDAPARHDGVYSTELFTDEAIAFIERHGERPWFLMLAYNAPHRADDRTTLPAPEAWSARFAGLEHVSDERKRTLAAVAALDEGIGRVLDALASRQLEDDTLVIVLSDNGPTQVGGAPGPLRGEKDTLDEGGIRVPCLVRWPGRLPAGSVCSQPFSAIDLAPTLLADACPTPPRDLSMDGRDVLPMLAGLAPSPHAALYWSHTSLHRGFGGERVESRAVRQGAWRLTVSPETGLELHDVVADPGQTRDEAAAQPQVVERLRALLDERAAATAAWNR